MFFADLISALAIGLILTVIFTLLFRNRGPWGLWWAFLLIVFFAAWAGGVWVQPFGPVWFGVTWMPYLFIGLLVAVLLAAATPRSTPRTRREALAQADEERAQAAALSLFFWLLLLGFIAAITLSYI